VVEYLFAKGRCWARHKKEGLCPCTGDMVHSRPVMGRAAGCSERERKPSIAIAANAVKPEVRLAGSMVHASTEG